MIGVAVTPWITIDSRIVNSVIDQSSSAFEKSACPSANAR